MSRIEFKFKGLMVPVCTSFNNDGSLNVDNVNTYAEYIKSEGIDGVLVAGTTGEGPSMTVSERKILTESWSKAAKLQKLTLMVQIGGASLPDVIELAKHAEKLKVDSVLCLPELYIKPKTEAHLVSYLSKIAKHCPKTPFLYYHIPSFTLVDLDMPTFCNLAEINIPNFVGIKYTSPNLDQGSACLKEGRSVLLGADTLLIAGLALGFDSAILATLNINPKICFEVATHLKTQNLSAAQKAQSELTKLSRSLTLDNPNFVYGLKNYFNNLRIDGLNLGPIREIYK